MATTIVTKNSSTAAAVPTAAQLVQGELAVNVADKRLYTEDSVGGIVELGTNPSAEIVANGGIALPDNGKATFGASDDLQIYHSGTGSYITDSGAGALYIQGQNLLLQNNDGSKVYFSGIGDAATLYYGTGTKLATTATGIDVTGSVVANSLTVDGTATAALGSFTNLNFDGYSPTVLYDFNNSGTVTSADALAYLKLGAGVSTGVDISAAPVLTTGWSAPTGAVYTDNKFRILAAKGNSTDALLVAGAGSASGYGDTIVIGNVDVNGVDTKLITGLGIDGPTLTLAGNVTATGTLAVTDAIAANGGLDVTGTATMDGLVVDGAIAFDSTIDGVINAPYSVFVNIDTLNNSSGDVFQIGRDATGTGAAKVFTAKENGDISFYEDTGVTPKLVWDASAESLGIGTSTPTFATGTGLQVTSGSFASVRVNHSGSTGLDVSQAGGGAGYLYLRDNADLIFGTNNTERMRIDSAGSTIIKSGNKLILNRTDNATGGEMSYVAGTGFIFNDANGDGVSFNQGVANKVRIDSAGNLLVGTTDTTLYDNIGTGTGCMISEGGRIDIADTGTVMNLNKLSTDGEILSFRKDGAPVGSIGSAYSEMYIGSGATGLYFNDTSKIIHTIDTVTLSGSSTDGTVDLGYSGTRFKDLYLSGGVHLGGTGAANKLDDYETGTWTPTLTYSGTDSGSTYYDRYGSYTKIGNIVHVRFGLRVLVEGTASTGYAAVSGLPFIVASVAFADSVGTLGGTCFTSTEAGIAIGGNGSTFISIRSGNGNANDITDGDFASNTYVFGQLTYNVS